MARFAQFVTWHGGCFSRGREAMNAVNHTPYAATQRTPSIRPEPRRAVLVVEVDGLRRRAGERSTAGESAVLEHVTRRLIDRAPALGTVSLLDDGRLALLCEGLDKLDAVALADQLVADARGASVFGLRFPLSIGVAAAPDDGLDEGGLLSAACLASSRASARGGDVVLGYHRGMVTGESGLRTAYVTSLLARSSVPIAFDPILTTDTGAMVGHAASCTLAADFAKGYSSVLEDAVRAGRLFELGQRVRLSTELAYRTVDDGHSLLFVEVHPAELLRAGLLIGETALRGMLSRVVVQLVPGTESTGVDLVVQVADGLRAHGVRFAIDELDARADGVSLLAALRPEYVLLGRKFVARSTEDGRRAEAVASFTEMAARLGAQVIGRAENSPESVRHLASLGIPLIRPVGGQGA